MCVWACTSGCGAWTKGSWIAPSVGSSRAAGVTSSVDATLTRVIGGGGNGRCSAGTDSTGGTTTGPVKTNVGGEASTPTNSCSSGRPQRRSRRRVRGVTQRPCDASLTGLLKSVCGQQWQGPVAVRAGLGDGCLRRAEAERAACRGQGESGESGLRGPHDRPGSVPTYELPDDHICRPEPRGRLRSILRSPCVAWCARRGLGRLVLGESRQRDDRLRRDGCRGLDRELHRLAVRTQPRRPVSAPGRCRGAATRHSPRSSESVCNRAYVRPSRGMRVRWSGDVVEAANLRQARGPFGGQVVG